MKPKLFRDPVHDIISFNVDEPTGQLLFALVRTREVQRLRRIRQLGLANLIYHGAEHSRFAHSLGVAHLAGRMLGQIGRHLPLSTEDHVITLAGALLHDIGHGPFSHAMEKIALFKHEELSVAIMLDPDCEVHHALSQIDPSLPQRVANLLQPEHPRSFHTDIISSQLDADRLDYILRDGLATGVKIGVYDLERIMSMLEASPEHLIINGRATEAVEGYLITRFHMFKQVYLHKAVRAAEVMLEAALRRASERLRDDDVLFVPSKPLLKLLSHTAFSPVEYVSIDDTDIWTALKLWSQQDRDPILRELCSGLVHRRIYKTIDLANIDSETLKEAIQRARQEITSAGGDPRFHLLVDHAADTPYKPYTPLSAQKNRSIMISHRGKLSRIEELSEIALLLGRDPYHITRLCLPQRFLSPVQQAVEATLGSELSQTLRRSTGTFPALSTRKP